jgi:hypothetical protein
MASDKAIAAYRSARAVEMRLAGEDYDEIAKELQYADRSGAWRAVDRALRARTDRAVEIYHQQRLAAIQRTLEAYQDAALSGSLVAVDKIVAAMGERVRLLFPRAASRRDR